METMLGGRRNRALKFPFKSQHCILIWQHTRVTHGEKLLTVPAGVLAWRSWYLNKILCCFPGVKINKHNSNMYVRGGEAEEGSPSVSLQRITPCKWNPKFSSTAFRPLKSPLSSHAKKPCRESSSWLWVGSMTLSMTELRVTSSVSYHTWSCHATWWPSSCSTTIRKRQLACLYLLPVLLASLWSQQAAGEHQHETRPPRNSYISGVRCSGQITL